MLNLGFRDEFLGAQMPGTAVPMRLKDNTGAAQQDRRKLVLHRTFKNRDEEIRDLVTPYAEERFRLRFSHLWDAQRGRIVEICRY